METGCIVYFHAEDSLSFKWFRTKTHRENQQLGNCLLFHSLNKSGFVPFFTMHAGICGYRRTSNSLRNHFELSTFSTPCWINSHNAMRANVTMSTWEWPEPDPVTSGFRENIGLLGVPILDFRWTWICRGEKNHFASYMKQNLLHVR